MSFVDRLLGSLGLSRAASPIPPMGQVTPELPIALQLQRIGGATTPAQVSAILRQADTGYVWQLQDLLHEARQKECHLQTVLGTRENAIRGLPWQIVAPEDGRRRDRKAAEFCEEVIRATGDFPDLLAHLAGGAYHGYSVAETLFAVRGGQVVPVGWSRLAPRRFCFEQDLGQLRWWDQGAGMPYPGVDVQAAYPGKFLVYQPRINGDVPCREGLGRVLLWASLFRNWTLRDWLALGEIAWKPWRVGTYKVGADKTSINNLRDIMRQMSASGVATKPDDVTIDVQWPKGNVQGATHRDLAEFLGGEMSKAVLGQTLTTESGSRGARSLGEVHDRVRRDILEADAVAIAACLQRDLLAPLVAWNFGDAAVPTFRFLTEEGVDLKAYSEAILNFKRAGLRICASDVRDKAGLREPDDDDEVLDVDVTFEDAPPPGAPAAPEAPDAPEAPPSGQADEPPEEEPQDAP